MACPATPFSYDAGGDLHDWLPIRVSHFSHKYVAFLELAKVPCFAYDLDIAGGNLFTCAFALRKHTAIAFQNPFLYLVPVFCCVDGFRPCLDNKQLPGLAVLGPFHVHWLVIASLPAVMVLNCHGPARQFLYLIICKDKPGPFLQWHNLVLGHLAILAQL